MSSSSKSDLRVDWASHQAAKYACENWHYSKRIPVFKSVKIGAWEGGKFVGVVMFGQGATPEIGSPYGLMGTEICELTRVALTNHRSPVSRIMALAIRFLRVKSPGLRLIVSFADAAQGHHGGIYQACNWIYAGGSATHGYVVNGQTYHPKSLHSKYGKGGQSIPWLKQNVDPSAQRIQTGFKHRYLMPLDDEMRAKVLPLAQPYPKRPKQETTGTTGTSAGQNRPGRSNNPPAAGPEPA